jgi:AcrR family transcriptional regulator
VTQRPRTAPVPTRTTSPPPAARASGERNRERNRDLTTQRILAAVGEVLARDGFSGIGINAVAQQAGVDKVLIYRYFGGLPELLKAWGDSGRFWPRVADLVTREPGLMALPMAERYARFFDHFIDELRARPLTLEILAAEVQDRNELTAILETEREQWGEEAGRVLGGAEFAAWPHAKALTILLVVAVQYLLVRSRKVRVFGGIDVRTDAGWRELKAAIHATALRIFTPTAAPAAPPPSSPPPSPPRAAVRRTRKA